MFGPELPLAMYQRRRSELTSQQSYSASIATEFYIVGYEIAVEPFASTQGRMSQILEINESTVAFDELGPAHRLPQR